MIGVTGGNCISSYSGMVLLIGYSTASRRSRQRSESAGIGPIGDGIATIRNDGSDRTMDEDPDVKGNQEDKDNERRRLVSLAKIYDIINT